MSTSRPGYQLKKLALISGPMPAPTFEGQAATEPPRRLRFTLWSLFVVVTMVAAVIGLGQLQIEALTD